jgi:hypothetical protein
MYEVTITGRKRRTVSLDEQHEPVVSFDETPLVARHVNEAAAKIDANLFVAELHDAPDAIVTLPDGTKMPLRDWLVKCGVENLPAPIVAPAAPTTIHDPIHL